MRLPFGLGLRFRTPWVWMVVVVVCGLMAVASQFADVIPPRAMTSLHMKATRSSIVAYVRAHGRSPTSLDDVPAVGDDAAVRTDGWGRSLGLRVERDGSLSLVSLGADGRAGGRGEDADMVATFDPKQPGDAPWRIDPFGRRPDQILWNYPPFAAQSATRP